GRAGWLGAVAAWIGFTLPSAVLLVVFALGLSGWATFMESGAIQGLKLAALAIVAHAVWSMARSLLRGAARIAIALVALLVVTMMPGSWGQVGAIVLGGLLAVAMRLAVPAASRARHD